MEIFYFSGTGNTLFIVQELQRRFPETCLMPLASLLNQDVIRSSAKTIGLVFPIQGLTAPVPIRLLMRTADFSSAEYVFAIATRGGSKCLALDYVSKRLKRRGKQLDAGFILTMGMNDPKLESFEDPSEDEIAALESAVLDRLDEIEQVVARRQRHLDDGQGVGFDYGPVMNFTLERLILLGVAYAERGGVRKYFEATDACVGCGTCEKVCLSKRITLVDQRPVWQQDIQCYMCYSCLNYCPTQAIQIRDKWYMKSHTRAKGRYSHPYATANDIAAQKDLAAQKVRAAQHAKHE